MAPSFSELESKFGVRSGDVLVACEEVTEGGESSRRPFVSSYVETNRWKVVDFNSDEVPGSVCIRNVFRDGGVGQEELVKLEESVWKPIVFRDGVLVEARAED